MVRGARIREQSPQKSYQRILEQEINEGLREINRPHLGQLISAISGGLEVSFSVFLMGVLLTVVKEPLASPVAAILIANAYFVPDETIVDMLVAARRRGVDVEIIVPGPILDAQVVRRASRGTWGPLLEAGVRIYEYQPTMYHPKVMVEDDVWVSVGSTNFDNRSFGLNDEVNLAALDPQLANTMSQLFQQDLSRANRVTYDQWQNRPIWERAVETAGWVIERQE